MDLWVAKKITSYSYNASLTTYTKVKSVENTYVNIAHSRKNDPSVTSCNCQPNFLTSINQPDYSALCVSDNSENYTQQNIGSGSLVDLYVDFNYLETGHAQLNNSTTYTYGPNGEDAVKFSTDYTYDPITNLVASEKTTDSKGKVLEKDTYYYRDYFDFGHRPDNIFTQLWNLNMVEVPMATETWQIKQPGAQRELLSSDITEYSQIPNGDCRLSKTYSFQSPIPVAENIIHAFNYNNDITNPPQFIRNANLIKPRDQINYDNNGLAVQINELRGSHINSTFYDYNNQYPIASVTNAPNANVAYISFEADGTGNWFFNPSHIVVADYCPTGKKCYQLSMNWDDGISPIVPVASILYIGQNTPYPYTLSFWATSDPIIEAAQTISSETKIGPTIKGWTYYQYTVAPGYHLYPIIFGNGKIDELRYYPATAQMSTTAYDPLIGVTSKCDINNRITHYEYDDLGRLDLIRDENWHIIKKFCYSFTGQSMNCDGATFYNDALSQTFTKNNCTDNQVGSNYTYSVPANKYSSSDPNQPNIQALTEINTNGQNAVNNDVNSFCYPLVYVKKDYTIIYSDVDGNHAKFFISLYSDPGCTQPFTLDHSLSFNVQFQRLANGSITYTSSPGTAQGYVGDNQVIINSDNVINCDGITLPTCNTVIFTLLPGAGYTVVSP